MTPDRSALRDGYALRPLSDADLDALADLLADDGGYSLRVNGRPPAASDSAAVLKDRPAGTSAAQHHVLALELGGRVDAVAVVMTDWPDPGVNHVALLQVRGALQGRGLGRTLHEAVVPRLCGAHVWRLTVVDDNAVALGFWEVLGYRWTGEVRQWRNRAGEPHEARVLTRSPASL